MILSYGVRYQIFKVTHPRRNEVIKAIKSRLLQLMEYEPIAELAICGPWATRGQRASFVQPGASISNSKEMNSSRSPY